MRRVPLVMAAAACLMAPAPAAAAPPPGACVYADPGGPVVRVLPWAQRALAPERVWPFSTGRGVVVAVIDSGVDADHPQLRGAVLPGVDLLGVSTLGADPVTGGRADFDCVSHGTAVASIIAARTVPGIGFHGVAPGARILPIRVSERDVGADEGTAVSPALFAIAIRRAVVAGASVINLSVLLYRDDPAVRAAVSFAQRHDVVVVAAAGNAHRDGVPDPTPYPTAYPGVLGVGAITIDGSRLPSAQVGPYVDVVAPGGGVLAATRLQGHRYWDGTSFATAFVSATVALVRSAYPDLSAAAVMRRVVATASPARGGAGYGHGVVDPYAAVTDSMSAAAPAALPSVVPSPPDRAAIDRAAQRDATASDARSLAGAAVAAGLIALAVAGVLRAGRRQRWTSGAAH